MTKIEKEIIDKIDAHCQGVLKHEKRYAVLGIVREALDEIHAERKYIPADILRSYQAMTLHDKEEAHRIYGEQTFTWVDFEIMLIVGMLAKEANNKDRTFAFSGDNGKIIYVKLSVAEEKEIRDTIKPIDKTDVMWTRIKRYLCK